MRILHLTPGTGSFHCGSCLRDNALIKALRTRRHEAVMVPLYLPLVTDDLAANPEIGVQVGGASLYIAQKWPTLARWMPGFVHRWLNQPHRLRKAAKGASMTSATLLGEMTLGSLQGRDSTQWSEWSKLIEWLKTQPKPDVVSLSNSLLLGLVPAIKEALGCKIVCSLQGEDSFLDTLEEPFRKQCWDAIRANAKLVDAFIAPSRFYAGVMEKRMGVDGIRVVANGMDLHPFPSAEPDPNYPTLGYFARMIHGKGLTMMVDAFIALAKDTANPRLRLKIGGAATAADDAYIAELKAKIAAAGLTQRVTWHPNTTFQAKVRFFRELTVFSVPATYGEAFGLYVIEAIASGVPVVQPRHGAFPEIIEQAGGGLLCEPDDLKSFTTTIQGLLHDAAERDQLTGKGMTAVRDVFSASRMAERFEQVLTSL